MIMTKNAKKILFILTPNEVKQFCLLVGMMTIVAILDMIGVASIMPFMAVLANPEVVKTNILLKEAYIISKSLGVENIKEFMLALGFIVFFILIFSLTFKALTSYLQFRYVSMCEYSIGRRLFELYLQQPYTWFLDNHSADLGKRILTEAEKVSGGVIKPIMQIIASSTITIALLTLLILTDPKLAIVSGLTLGVFYVVIYSVSKNYLGKIGKERLTANQLRFTVTNEAFGATKEIKTSNLENNYVEHFISPAKTYARHQATGAIISALPRFALEIIAFGGLLIITLYLMSNNENLSNLIPILALYTLAGYRLLPALQGVYSSMALLRFHMASLDEIHNDFESLSPIISVCKRQKLHFNKMITLNNVHYHYPNNEKLAIKGINLRITALSTVAVVGATGSGKTTIIDLILGLLQPQKGTLEIDGEIIGDHNLKAWKSFIGYVPQQIFLSDDTISANIAFGVPTNEIDKKALKKAAVIANLHDFINSELPLKYNTVIGERGIRLSGGQRQRIGIARALYHKPKVLIMDEATNALDNLTEKSVMEAVNKLSNKITIILIAHRLSTVKNCDKIFVLDKGQLIASGDYNQLTRSNKYFQNLSS